MSYEGPRLIGPGDRLIHPTAFSPWSLVHTGAGIVAYIVMKFTPISFNQKLLIWGWTSTAYESHDMSLTYVREISQQNTLLNAAGDIICNILGFYIGKWIFSNTSIIVDIIFIILFIIFYKMMGKYVSENEGLNNENEPI